MNGRLIVKTIMWLFRLTPFAVICALGDVIGCALFYLLKERTALGLSNLSLAFPEKSEEQRRKILKASWRNFCKDMLELIKYCAMPPAAMGKRVVVVGKAHLDSVVTQKRGVVILSAHLGGFPILCMELGREGYPIAVVYSKVHNRLFNPVLPQLMKSKGIEPIRDKPKHACVSRSLSWLKKGGMLFIQIDQSPPTEAAVSVRFFGVSAPTSRGAVSMAMRTGAVILPAFIVRKKNNRHRIIIDKPFDLKLTGNTEQDVINNLESLSEITEGYIRQYPTHWWWIHQRFRKAAAIP